MESLHVDVDHQPLIKKPTKLTGTSMLDPGGNWYEKSPTCNYGITALIFNHDYS